MEQDNQRQENNHRPQPSLSIKREVDESGLQETYRVLDGGVPAAVHTRPNYDAVWALPDTGRRIFIEVDDVHDANGKMLSRTVREVEIWLNDPERRRLITVEVFRGTSQLRLERRFDREGRLQKLCTYKYHPNGALAEEYCIDYLWKQAQNGRPPWEEHIKSYDTSGRLDAEFEERMDDQGKSQGGVEKKYHYDARGKLDHVDETPFPPA